MLFPLSAEKAATLIITDKLFSSRALKRFCINMNSAAVFNNIALANSGLWMLCCCEPVCSLPEDDWLLYSLEEAAAATSKAKGLQSSMLSSLGCHWCGRSALHLGMLFRTHLDSRLSPPLPPAPPRISVCLLLLGSSTNNVLRLSLCSSLCFTQPGTGLSLFLPVYCDVKRHSSTEEVGTENWATWQELSTHKMPMSVMWPKCSKALRALRCSVAQWAGYI